ncbi:MAG: ATP-binding protein [Bacteroidales bacterium]|nr:ATP-binding protein [Bacteroidales bacterium]
MQPEKEHIFTLTTRPLFRRLFLLVFAVCIVAVAMLQYNYYSRTYNTQDLDAFTSVLHQKERVVQDIFNELSESFASGAPLEVLDARSEEFRELASVEDISFYFFQDSRLAYWSDHSVPLRTRWSARFSSPVYETLNGTYVALNREVEDGHLYALILVRKDYLYENDYLEGSYQEDFHVGEEVPLLRQTGPGLADVHKLEGDYLFSLDLFSSLRKNPLNVTLAGLLVLLGIISLFAWFILNIDAGSTRRKRSAWLIGSILTMVLIPLLIIYLEAPRIIFEAEFFQPEIYASMTFPSLGQLFFFILMVFSITLLFYWFFDRSGKLTDAFNRPLTIVVVLASSVWFVFAHHMMRSLVLDSTISFEAYQLDTLSVYTFFGLFVMLMSLMVFILLFDKALKIVKTPGDLRKLPWLLLPGFLVLLPFLFAEKWHLEWGTPLFFIAIASALIYLKTRVIKLKFSQFFVLIFLVSVFLTIDLRKHSSEKLNAQKEIELAKLSTEHDAVAEMLFSDLTNQLQSDSALVRRLSYEIIDRDLIFEYLQRAYFSGYWTKYDLMITLCRPPDSVYIEAPEERWYPCYSFFEGMVGDEGILVEDSNFYFLNNLNGRISYLGWIPYTVHGNEISLFLELDSKIISEELGYPTLLMREGQKQGEVFSYAKYNRGKLITSSGAYNYRLSPDYYTEKENTFENIRMGGFDHTIFNVDPENTVIVSLPVVSFVDKLISFSYIFAYIFALFALTYLVVSASHLRATVTWDFKNKIQYSMIGVLFLTFLVICTGTIYFVIQQYRMKHHDTLQNTMRSLYIELVHKVEYEDDLRNWSSDSYYNLDELLRKFSNVFYTDINMYDEQGLLLATSRNEIFDQGLLSIRMNRETFDRLSGEDYSAFIHTERIGRMSYQSAYIPLLNNDNKFLAYLNLPYFTQPEILAQEVTNLVVAILNTYVLLLLLILFLSVFLADRITQPLRFIQSRIAQLSLSESNEKIIYKGKDEIAGLVDEYNYMVDELEKSAELLAQSERESAWREMAKQIAHEIKNPLTPMKLNVQHMQRMIEEDEGDIRERIARVSATLVEQIDLLGSIANEFSDFARMPRANYKKINIVKKLHNVTDLFENTEGVHIALDTGGLKDIRTYGDPEQFQRVIINLVKNGIQSVPEGREKKILITLEEAPEQTVIVTVTDNGKGIAEEVRDKLFRPNFTTKSGGMGMGLAISANIVKSMGGNIWFRTRSGEGTSFFVKVPVA